MNGHSEGEDIARDWNVMTAVKDNIRASRPQFIGEQRFKAQGQL